MRKFGIRKALFVLSLLLIVALIGASCAKPAPVPTPTFTPRAGATPTPLPTATPVPVKPIRMKTAAYGGPTYVQRMVFERAMETIKQKSGGRIEFDYFPGEQLLKLTETFEGVRTGIVQMAVSTSTYERERMGIIYESVTYPFSWDVDKFHKNRAWRAPGMYYEFAEPYWNKWNMHLLAQPRVPYGELYFRKPVKKLEDLKGLLVRSTTSFAPVFKLLGAEPVFLALPDIYSALQRGTLDGAATTIQDYVSAKRFEVAKYVVIVHQYSGNLDHVINLDFFNSLPKDLQKIIEDAFVEAEDWWATIAFDDYNKMIEDSKKGGADIYVLPEAELKRWKDAIQPFWNDQAKLFPAEWERFNKIRLALS